MCSDNITICCHCNAMQEESGYYNPKIKFTPDVIKDNYNISHGLCNDCCKEHYPEAYKRIKENTPPNKGE